MPSHTMNERKKRRKEKELTLAQQISGGLRARFPGSLGSDHEKELKRRKKSRRRRGVAAGKRLR